MVGTIDERSEASTSRIIVDKDADCERLGIKKPLFICAPMVRYSKLPFRKLVSMYNVDLCFTPMLYAIGYSLSEECRADAFDFTDFPIVQFAAKDPIVFANATEIVYGQGVRGVDLNCGCPKSDVRKEGVGSKLLEDPQLICDIVKQARARVPDPAFTMSTKIRIKYPIERSVDLCRQLESAGVDFISVHGRTINMHREPADYEAIKLIKSSVKVPVYANGGCKTYEEALNIAKLTGADGIMAAEGLLANPALFAGHPKTPVSCVEDWFDIGKELGIPSSLFHKHFSFMSRSMFKKKERIEFSEILNPDAIVARFSELKFV
ncbi:TRNA-dihydrouridine synthase [Aphelenchoides bicaudatus]|nr:TRNA-dihydrouridine synthase [Aphelenchoides bicaudatus]